MNSTEQLRLSDPAAWVARYWCGTDAIVASSRQVATAGYRPFDPKDLRRLLADLSESCARRGVELTNQGRITAELPLVIADLEDNDRSDCLACYGGLSRRCRIGDGRRLWPTDYDYYVGEGEVTLPDGTVWHVIDDGRRPYGGIIWTRKEKAASA